MSIARLTQRQRLDRDLHSLEGILKGIAVDTVINNAEMASLRDWCTTHAEVASSSPFDEIIPKLEQSVGDGVLDSEEREDLLWLISKCSTPNDFYNAVTSDLQRLHGLMAGIGADGHINDTEIHGLANWLEGAKSLNGNWPYDEIDSFVTAILADGIIDQKERKLLLGFCAEFASNHVDLLLAGDVTSNFVNHGVCAMTPEITFAGNTFCLTGASHIAKRTVIHRVIHELGGQPHPRVVQDLNYLIVCNAGNRHWAFSCYGRKVEQVMKLRKQNKARIIIAHEHDLWDAVEDHGGRRP